MNSKSESIIRSGQFPKFLVTLLLTAALQEGRAASGDVDPSFDPGSTIDGAVNACAIQPDGKVLIGGNFNTLHYAERSKVARLHKDGSNDETFLNGLSGVESDGRVQCLVIQTNGQVIIGGYFSCVNGMACTNIARLNADGSLDTNFVSCLNWPDGEYPEIDTICLQPDGKILIAGWFDSVGGLARTNIARLNSDGSLDVSFNVVLADEYDPLNPWSGLVNAVVVQDDGKIMVGGWFTLVNGWSCTNLVRLDEGGAVDTGFQARLAQADWLGGVNCLAIQPNQQIVVGGSFTVVNGLALTNLTRFNSNGSLDESFYCPQLDPFQNAPDKLIPYLDGKLIAQGSFTPDGTNYWYTVLLNTNGQMDFNFTNQFLPGFNTVAIQEDGKLVIVGGFSADSWFPRGGVARLNADGSVDASFDNGEPIGIGGSPSIVTTQSDGKILIGGDYLNSINGRPLYNIARLNSDGTLDDSFNTILGGQTEGNIPSGPFFDVIKVLNDGKILLAGSFGSINGVTRNGLARLNPDGTLDEGFLNNLSGANNTIADALVQTNGQILVGGWFSKFNDQPRYDLARLNPDGSLDPTFANVFFRLVCKLAVQSDGKILIVSSGRLFRANSDGTADDSFSMQVDGSIEDMILQPDGKILLSGGFRDVSHNHYDDDFRVVRLNPDGTPDPTFMLTALPADYSFLSGSERISLQEDGKIVLTGRFAYTNGCTLSAVFRFFPDGLLDLSFSPDFHHRVPDGVAVQPDGKILFCGGFSAVNQVAMAGVVRLMGNCVSPTLGTTPQTCTAENCGTAHLSASASGYPAPHYQWYFNGTNAIAGGTNRVLCLNDVQFSQIGNYSVVISNAGGVVTSAPVVMNVIAAVERRAVPALQLFGDSGSTFNLEVADGLSAPVDWSPLATVNLTGATQYLFDTSLPLPSQRFYRTWQTGTPTMTPALNLNFVPALTLTGSIGDKLRVDCINQVGPTNAWVTLDTVTLTNTSQLYFDASAPHQPARLYRIVPVP